MLWVAEFLINASFLLPYLFLTESRGSKNWDEGRCSWCLEILPMNEATLDLPNTMNDLLLATRINSFSHPTVVPTVHIVAALLPLTLDMKCVSREKQSLSTFLKHPSTMDRDQTPSQALDHMTTCTNILHSLVQWTHPIGVRRTIAPMLLPFDLWSGLWGTLL